MEVKYCIACKTEKPLTEFHYSNGRPRSRCKPCRNAQNQAWNLKHADTYGPWLKDYKSSPDFKLHRNRKARERYARDPEYRQNIVQRNRTLSYKFTIKHKYGMTLDAYIAMLDAQDGRCPICSCDLTALGRRTDGTTYLRAHIDHDHQTGKVRGLLCSECNVGLGKFLDRADLLHAAAKYLQEHEQSRKPLEGEQLSAREVRLRGRS